jgi:hypothetical protein
MATWQADFRVELGARGLVSDYRDRIAKVLPVGRSWSDQLEVWGKDDGACIRVFSEGSDSPELTARFDLRHWRPELYAQFVALVVDIGGALQTSDERAVQLDVASFESVLRTSEAARFAEDPEGFLRQLSQERGR